MDLQRDNRRFHSIVWGVLAVLLAALVLRLNQLSWMELMLHTDEAYYASDAVSVIQHFRLTPYFTPNDGHEAGFIYLLAGWLAGASITPFAARLLMPLLGVLNVAAIYRLGGRLFDRRIGLYAAAGMAVLWWDVLFKHLVLRANTFPLVGALAFSFLFEAMQTRKQKAWVATGVWFGLMAYTYFAEIVWLGFAGAIQVVWALRDQPSRRGVLTALGISAAMIVPLAVYVVMNWSAVTTRLVVLGTADSVNVWDNALIWMGAFVYRGSPFLEYNLPNRPILDLPLALLFYAGLFTLALMRRRPWPAWWVLVLGALCVGTALPSIDQPGYTRALGLTVPLSLAVGAGARAIQERLRFLRGWSMLVPLSLLIWAGSNSYRDMSRYLRQDQIYVMNEQHITTGTAFIAKSVPPDQPVYFSPFDVGHPNVRFAEGWLAPRPVSSFKAESCIVISTRSATYFSLVKYDIGFREQLSRWMNIAVLAEDPAAPLPWVVFNATARPDALAEWQEADKIVFGDQIAVRAMSVLPDHASPGDVIPVWIGAAVRQPFNIPYKGFVHLYGDPSPYEGGPIHAQTDQAICPSHPPDHWREDEIILTRFNLALPPDIQPGEYTIVFGIYDGETLARLPITTPAGGGDHWELHTLTIP